MKETKGNSSLNKEEVKNNVIIIDGHEVLPLFDPPHILKNIRHNLCKKDLTFIKDRNRYVTSWSHIIKAYEIDQGLGGLRNRKNLTEYHTLPKKIKEMKVSLCSQVFSATVASFKNFAAGTKGPSLQRRYLPKSATGTASLKFLDSVYHSVNGGFENGRGKL